MATVSERARICASGLIGCDFAMAQKLIEQALLAERRLAKLEDAELAKKFGQDRQGSYGPGESIRETFNDGLVYGSLKIHEVLRAAAEKEVGTE